jgi:predicted HAD superfamily Cof-like phosphohydrolase
MEHIFENQEDDLELVDNALLDALRETESETSTEKEVDVSQIFQRIDLKRASKIIHEGKNQNAAATSKSQKPTLLNEEYLKELIYEQVELALDSAMAMLADRILMNIQQLIQTTNEQK